MFKEMDAVFYIKTEGNDTLSLEGRVEGHKEILAQLRALGADENMLSQAVKNLKS